jgi:hypothetical protein
MAGINSVPDEVKWRIAAEFSATLPALYDRVFRAAIGDTYSTMEQKVWLETSVIVADMVKTLSLPHQTAKQLAEAVDTAMKILFGPEFKNEVLDIPGDSAVIIVRRCPILAHASRSGLTGEQAFNKCMAFTLASVPMLNKEFSARFVRTMCTGDRQCEIKIQKVLAPESSMAKDPDNRA